jgi:hypothetical protein
MIDPKLIDVTLPLDEQGYPEHLAAEDTPDVLRDVCMAAGMTVVPFPEHFRIPRRNWLEVQKLGEKNRTRPIDFLDRHTNQTPTHECTCHAAGKGFEAARNRQRRIACGPPVAGQMPTVESASVWLSKLSVYAEANPRERGGANVRQVLEISGRRGWLPDLKQPRDWGFRHAMQGTAGKGGACQSNGPFPGWSRSDFIRKPAGWVDGNWQDTAKHFRPLEVVFPRDFEEAVCLELGGPEAMGIGLVTGGRGHSIWYGFVDVENEVFGYPDSYDVIRYDSFRSWRSGGIYGIVSTTTPDDWDKPAG